ncbi:Ino eighty subunit 1 [Favolaschia claudopus]|uniref:Ino eighty subunit 1 n=1 Tax=Favolaschia claudopus TaxID=2862362 RepID=A0AAW0EIU3_9AGAR
MIADHAPHQLSPSLKAATMRAARQRKPSVAIDCADGEVITRADIQFEFLSHIFKDETKAFSDPTSGPDGEKLSFRDLYVKGILASAKAKSVLKETNKLARPEFPTDFGKLCLLTNAGRIASTMSFFPEMRTAQRTYHPIPCLQRTNGNLMDAPRIKSILKTCILEGDTAKNGLATPAQVLARIKAGQIPPTTLPNLIFVFANHSAEIGRNHLPDMEFLDLFLPNSASSASRARIFLWLCYHYHEGASGDSAQEDDSDLPPANPFSDASRPGKVPELVMLTAEEVALENLDPDDEKALASRLIAQREAIVHDHQLKESAKESKAKAEAESISGDTPSPAKPKRKRANAKAGPSTPLKRDAPPSVKKEDPEPDDIYLKKLQLGDDDELDLVPTSQMFRSAYLQPEVRSPIRELPPPRHPARSFPAVSQPLPPQDPYSPRYSPYKRHRPRTMLQHAWHVIATSDPLADSDEDEDEYVRRDHAERLAVISRVRGKPPTPEPEGFRPIPLGDFSSPFLATRP